MIRIVDGLQDFLLYYTLYTSQARIRHSNLLCYMGLTAKIRIEVDSKIEWQHCASRIWSLLNPYSMELL